MASVDDLCRSYLDLKYHFDPAAASSAGLVSHDARLGRFDAETTRAHVAALRVGGGRDRGARAGRPADRDRPHRAARRDPEHRSSGCEHERPHVRNPIFWLSPSSFRVSTRVALAAATAPPAGARPRRSSGCRPSRRSSTPRATRWTSRPRCSSTPRSACWAAAASWWCSWPACSAREVPELQPRAAAGGRRGARGAQAVRHRAARRDRAGRRSPRLRDRRGAVQPAAAPRARARGRRARALALRAAPAGGDRGRARRRSRPRMGAPAVARGGRGAPRRRARARARCSTSTGPSWTARDAFVAERDLVSIPGEPVDVVPTPSFMLALVPFAAYEPPPIFLVAPDAAGST